MERIAIIGTGVAGLGCAYFLRDTYEVTLFDQGNYVGGHTNTITVPGEKGEVAFDTGFMVFNKVTYPNLTRLFKALQVEIKPTSMSFSVQHVPQSLEFCGSSVNHLFAQRRNLFRPSFWRLLGQIDRFNREAVETLTEGLFGSATVAEYVEQKGYGEHFLNCFLIPMSAAVWSTPPDKMRDFPATALLRFFHNHGFLGLHTQHPWFTVQGGSRNYVKKIVDLLPKSSIRLNDGVVKVSKKPSGVELTMQNGTTNTFDQVILACHGDQALKMLAEPTPLEERLLNKFHYQPNLITIHTDRSVMPRKKLAWASWNYRIDSDKGVDRASTHYWMNSLQGLPQERDYFVSLNYDDRIVSDKILRRIDYEHPLFDLFAMESQKELPQINRQERRQPIHYCGSYFRYGFHEDAFASAVDLCALMLNRDPWENQ